MFRKVDIKILASVFVVLLALVIVVELVDSRKGNRSFKGELVNVNADEVTAIEILPRVTNQKSIRLFKESNKWKVEFDGKTYNADASSPRRLINLLNDLKPKTVAANKEESWEKYELTDSLATRVKLYKASELVADILIGKFSFSQSRNMTSYVRLADDKTVYGVEGMPGSSFNRKVDAFRDRTLIKSDQAYWTKLSFEYPADSSFVLEKRDSIWWIGETKADSAAVAQYFNQIESLYDGNFTDEEPSGNATHRLVIEGDPSYPQIEVKGYRLDNDRFMLTSSLNPKSFVDSKSTAVRLFVGKSTFIKQ